MKIFEAKTLKEAYEQATKEFACSITEFDITIIQEASNGFLGFGKKNALIEVVLKHNHNQKSNHKKTNFLEAKKDIKIKNILEEIKKTKEASTLKINETKEEPTPKIISKVPIIETKEKIFDNFYDKEKKIDDIGIIKIKKDKDKIIEEVQFGLNSLFDNSCYDMEKIKVEFFDEGTLYIEFKGKDSALLIGKEGYRYKALSYILFNWINNKFNLMLRLEIAEFLQNQENAIDQYLEPVIKIIYEKGFFKTKLLDGILVHITLTRLREEFPNKYIVVKKNIKGSQYILVNEYKTKDK